MALGLKQVHPGDDNSEGQKELNEILGRLDLIKKKSACTDVKKDAKNDVFCGLISKSAETIAQLSLIFFSFGLLYNGFLLSEGPSNNLDRQFLGKELVSMLGWLCDICIGWYVLFATGNAVTSFSLAIKTIFWYLLKIQFKIGFDVFFLLYPFICLSLVQYALIFNQAYRVKKELKRDKEQ